MSKSTFEVNRETLEVKISRMFHATPERLWQAYTEADQIPLWWNDVNVETLDVRVGGKWRFVDKSGGLHSFRGEFTGVDKPHKLARAFEYDTMADFRGLFCKRS